MESAEPGALFAWLRDRAWPLWLEHGIDRARGGFYEALDLHTHRCAAPFRRLRVVARQVFVFSHAHEAGIAGAADAVRLGLAFLENHAAQREGGYAWRFDLHHRVIDARRDLYDHAFVLLAFAASARVVGAAAMRARAVELLAWMRRAFVHPVAGYQESVPPCLPRRQNPHMHFLEAVLASHQVFGDAVFLDCARELVALFADRLFDAEAGALPEFFDDAFVPERTNGVFLVEPGHHCEWVWLLRQAWDCDERVPGLCDRLMGFVDRFGVNAAGFVVDEVGSDGRVLSAASRLWPQTERLRADGVSARPLAAYLRPDGLWHERRFADGRFSDEPAPASSLYHLTGAILSLPDR